METKTEKPLNRQLFANSGLQALFDEDDLSSSSARPFFNGKAPNLAILHEKPEHRVLLMCKARGLSNREIAKQTGYTEPWLSQLFRQPWARALLSEFLQDAGIDELTNLIRSEAVPAFQRLVEIRDMELTPKTAPVIASTCLGILDRHLGKPVQQVKVESDNTSTLTTITEVDQKIAELETETNRLLGVKQ